MKNLKKKGFTIVELVIVIAVLAVLAAVLIPTFVNLTKKANLSADQQTVANMNKFTTIGVVEGEYEYASDALKALYAEGFNQGKLATYSSNYHYAYDFENNKFYLLDDTDKPVYPDKKVEVSNLWGFYNNSKDDKIQGVTKYIALTPIFNTVAFYDQEDSVFYGTDNFTLDLNKNYIGIEGKSNITIINGQANDTCEFKKGNNVELRTVITTGSKPLNENGVISNGVYTLENIVVDCSKFNTIGAWEHADSFGDATSVVFKNCTFVNAKNIQVGSAEQKKSLDNNVKSYLFDNCTFTNNADAVVLYVHGSAKNLPDVTIKNCYISAGRGITLGVNGVEDAVSAYGNIVIENNTFINVLNSEKPLIQLSASRDKADTDFVPKLLGIFKCNSLVIKNNSFVGGSYAIRIHDTIKEIHYASLVFSNNQVAEKMSTIVGDGTSESENIAKEWASKFN